jgi:REP-associated tyrosine transposase
MRSELNYRTWRGSRGNRLPRRNYPKGFPVHAVTTTALRRPVFADPTLARLAFSLVLAEPRTLAACLMPDHLHWLLADASEMESTVRRLKSVSTRSAHVSGWSGPLWQRSYWDHVVRRAEDLERLARYIVENPVRRGLVAEAERYPFQVIRLGALRNP